MKLTLQQKKTLLTLLFIGTISSLDKSMIGLTVIAVGEEFSLLPSQTSIILSVFYIGYMAITIPAGWFVDRFGYKKFLLSSLAILVIFSFCFSLPSSLALLAFARLFVGVGHAGFTNGSPKIINDNFIGKQKSSIQSIVLMATGIGGVLAYTVGVALVNYNWRLVYWIIATLFFVAFLLMFLLVPEKKKVHQDIKEAKKISIFDGWKSRNTLVLALGLLFNNLVNVALLSWMPSILRANFNMESKGISLILTGNAIVMAVATAAAGFILRKYFTGKEKTFVFLSCILTAVGLMAFITSSNLFLTVTFLYIVTALSMFTFTTFLSLPYQLIPSSIIGSSFAVINIGAFIGGIVSPLIIGNLVTIAGGSFFTGFIAMAIAMVLCGLTPSLLKTGEKAEKECEGSYSASIK